MFNPNAECKHELPGTHPRTVVWFHAYTQEDQTVAQMNGVRIRRAELQVGRDADDPSVVKKGAEADRASVASSIIRVENLHEDGDSVTDKPAIEALLKALPLSEYVRLTNAMAAGLGCFEGKA